jgi:arylsulfatase
MKARFLEVAKENKAFPIGAGNWLRIHPEDRVASPYRSWHFDATTTRMPEFTAPGLGRESNRVTMEVEVGEDASGVSIPSSAYSARPHCYMDKGFRTLNTTSAIVQKRYLAKSAQKIPPENTPSS